MIDAIRKFERVHGSSITVEVPEHFQGRQVEIVVLMVGENPSGHMPDAGAPERTAPFLLQKPVPGAEARRVMERQAAGIPDPAFRFDEPFAPAITDDDFDLEFPETDSKSS